MEKKESKKRASKKRIRRKKNIKNNKGSPAKKQHACEKR